MAIIVPNSGSTITAAASFSGGSPQKWTWLGLAAGSVNACVVWYIGTAASAGSPFLPIALSPFNTLLFGPFAASNWFAASVDGGSALFQQRQ